MVDVDMAEFPVEPGDEVGKTVYEGAQLPFSFVKRLFNPIAFGDVAGDVDSANYLSLLVEQRGTANEEIAAEVLFVDLRDMLLAIGNSACVWATIRRRI